jgi:hypothetical protein
MHKATDRSIELRRITFTDVPTPLDGPAQHTRSALRSANPLSTEGAIPLENSKRRATISSTGSDEPSSDVQSTITLEPASPVILGQSERLSQPPERCSPGLFLTDTGEPTTYREAMEATDAASWQVAMESEMNSIRANKTWDLVELTRNQKAIPCKWVYRLKQVSDSSSPKYKAHIIAKGFRQQYGVDFDKVFAPIVKMTTLRFLLGVVTLEDLELLQLDVKTTFLHGDLDEEIYMEQLQGFASPGREHLVYRLRKSLYGLKQAARQWYRKSISYDRLAFFSRMRTIASIARIHQMGVHLPHSLCGQYAALRSTYRRAYRAPMANVVEVRNEGPRSNASYSRDEDHMEPTFATVVSVSVRLHPTNILKRFSMHSARLSSYLVRNQLHAHPIA